MSDDILRDLLRRMVDAYPAIPPEVVGRVEIEARQVWGGLDVYIRKEPKHVKTYRLAESRAAGEGTGAAFKRAGVSRRHGFRLMKRIWEW